MMRNVRTKTARAAVAAAVLVLAAGGAQAQEKFRVAADVGYAPHVMAKPTGGVEGMNIDIGEAIAKKMGMQLEVIDQQWSGIFAGLNAKKYDMIVAPTTITEERAKSMLFTEGYFESEYQFVIKKGAPQVTSLDDLKGKVLSVNKGNLYDKWATEREPQYGWTVMRFDKNADAIAAVIAGRATANMAGSTVGGWAAKQNPMIVPSTLIISTGLVFGMAFRLDDVALRNKVETIMECLKKDGTIAAAFEKWTGQKPGPDAVVHTIDPGFGAKGFNGYDPTPHEVKCG
ncbi:polar amino acid transport system substrate-binding protein [Constrictibacter sp. MBR-5]|jgi:polar amino acid transport system substrate-binding protein|uniref:transporter substrate-binding domain-containing protein n=1 Tax=Constrictibacter sp. MBR-5 TaxID=3156467 RepID=UPI003391A1A9